MKNLKHSQMSESLPVVLFLSLSGGLQDAYTYYERGKVFANAQTGNIVLMSAKLFDGQWIAGMRYLIPLLAFALGVFAAEQLRARFQSIQIVHWRQVVVAIEILFLFITGFLPLSSNLIANALVSFSCAMQVQSFRKMNGNAYASTMCIGNMRSGVAAFSAYVRTKDRKRLHAAFEYFRLILLFALGAGLGNVACRLWGLRAIWLSCGLLLITFLLMFIKEEIEEHERKQEE